MNKYKPIGKIGEGTFSDVLKTQSLRDGNYYACKQMKQHFESIEQVNSLREIQALRRLNPHPNILMLHEVVLKGRGICRQVPPGQGDIKQNVGCQQEHDEFHGILEKHQVIHQQNCEVHRGPVLRLMSDRKSGSLALICELMDMNIYELIRGRRKPLPEKKIMNYMYQLCKSLDHMHRNGIFHRDVKPENILIKFSQQDTLKLGDFGSCRSVYSKQPYTEYISTRWYRAPECLLTDGYYSYKMDMWSSGCVFYEITSFHPLFPGSNELDQISKIHDILGTPAKKTLNKFKQSRAMSFDFPFKKGTGLSPHVPNISPKSLSLMYAMIEYDPDQRIGAHQALQHPYFQELRTAEKQAVTMHRKMRLAENIVGQESINLWCIPKDGNRQHSLRKTQENPVRHHGPSYAIELPKLNVSGVTKLTSYPSPSFHSVFTTPATNGEVPVLQPIKYIGTNHKSEKQKELKSSMKQYHLPTIERRGGGY
ncbi:MAPK/MAK/MRK overlapping kinase isoform X3 [Mauremys mutica]|uniref:MAPK/MAK/MRK overlapping kinase isoform X3 n=1 Tax=Mauremys mutica TaxID=74926 RepID=UPI001D1650F3|nr:MAPK/MAK/MRK overlapping kinase isoform X3 [Mauremys mutica]